MTGIMINSTASTELIDFTSGLGGPNLMFTWGCSIASL